MAMSIIDNSAHTLTNTTQDHEDDVSLHVAAIIRETVGEGMRQEELAILKREKDNTLRANVASQEDPSPYIREQEKLYQAKCMALIEERRALLHDAVDLIMDELVAEVPEGSFSVSHIVSSEDQRLPNLDQIEPEHGSQPNKAPLANMGDVGQVLQGSAPASAREPPALTTTSTTSPALGSSVNPNSTNSTSDSTAPGPSTPATKRKQASSTPKEGSSSKRPRKTPTNPQGEPAKRGRPRKLKEAASLYVSPAGAGLSTSPSTTQQAFARPITPRSPTAATMSAPPANSVPTGTPLKPSGQRQGQGHLDFGGGGHAARGQERPRASPPSSVADTLNESSTTAAPAERHSHAPASPRSPPHREAVAQEFSFRERSQRRSYVFPNYPEEGPDNDTDYVPGRNGPK